MLALHRRQHRLLPGTPGGCVMTDGIVYRVLDPDPTGMSRAVLCGLASDEGYYCTWGPDHTQSQHIAGTGYRIAAVWPVTP